MLNKSSWIALNKQWGNHLSYNMTPSCSVPVFRLVSGLDSPKHAISFFSWGMDLGFKPSNTKYSTFNCRVESLENKHSAWNKFLGYDTNIASSSPNGSNINSKYNLHHCVVLAEGYYEWKTVETNKSDSKKKIPYYITSLDNKRFYEYRQQHTESQDSQNNDTSRPKRDLIFFAGLCNQGTVTIITRPAQTPEMAEIHEREPVMMRSIKEVFQWLENTSDLEEFKDKSSISTKDTISVPRQELNDQSCSLNLLSLPDPSSLVHYRVSNSVGNPKNSSMDLTFPLTEGEISLNKSKPVNLKRKTEATGKNKVKIAKLSDFFSVGSVKSEEKSKV